MLDGNECQFPDHPITLMKMIKGRENSMSAAKDERLQVPNSHVICDGIIDQFAVFRNNNENHYGRIGVGYLFDTEF
jgi:hypothetical protein